MVILEKIIEDYISVENGIWLKLSKTLEKIKILNINNH